MSIGRFGGPPLVAAAQFCNPAGDVLLAGDIGGTKTLLGLFEPLAERPRPVKVQSFSTLAYRDLSALITAFLTAAQVTADQIEGASFGVAGPVLGETAELTNVPWTVDAAQVARQFGIPRVHLLNDLQSMAHGIPVLYASEIHTLQEGEARRGNIGLIAAGTGLGVALLHLVDGRLVPSPSEGGHADFAARDDRDVTLLRWLIGNHGRAEVEAVVSGRGLLNIHRVFHREPCPEVPDLENVDAAAEITAAAAAGRCASCVETVDVFVCSYGAEAGNLAVRFVSTGGFYIGGGIAPKILPALTDGRFIKAFLSKGPMQPLLAAMPVKVILNPEIGLLGAAVHAASQTPP
jgi:glucokinase